MTDMTEREADDLAAKLLAQYKTLDKFEVSMPDEHQYNQLAAAFTRLSCRTGPDGEFFRLQVYPGG